MEGEEGKRIRREGKRTGFLAFGEELDSYDGCDIPWLNERCKIEQLNTCIGD